MEVLMEVLWNGTCGKPQRAIFPEHSYWHSDTEKSLPAPITSPELPETLVVLMPSD